MKSMIDLIGNPSERALWCNEHLFVQSPFSKPGGGWLWKCYPHSIFLFHLCGLHGSFSHSYYGECNLKQLPKHRPHLLQHTFVFAYTKRRFNSLTCFSITPSGTVFGEKKCSISSSLAWYRIIFPISPGVCFANSAETCESNVNYHWGNGEKDKSIKWYCVRCKWINSELK